MSANFPRIIDLSHGIVLLEVYRRLQSNGQVDTADEEAIKFCESASTPSKLLLSVTGVRRSCRWRVGCLLEMGVRLSISSALAAPKIALLGWLPEPRKSDSPTCTGIEPKFDVGCSSHEDAFHSTKKAKKLASYWI